ncbi:MAG: glycosyltransferase, partial [bacterium]
HEVTVWTTDVFDKKSRIRADSNPAFIDGVKVFYFRSVPNRLLPEYPLPLSWDMLHEIRHEISRFDIVHLHGFRNVQNILLHTHLKRNGIPYVQQAHGSLPRIGKSGLKWLYDLFWGRKVLKDASKVIAFTETEAGQYLNAGVSKDKIEVVPNAINLSQFEDLPAKGEFRRKYNLGTQEKIILSLGRIHRIKGLDLLAKALARISPELGNVKLVIVGPDSGYLFQLKRVISQLQIEDRVLFTGPLYDRAKLEAYVDADVFVLPSVYEASPDTVLEACACGIPVVMTDRCGIAEIFGGEAGFVVPYDEEQLGDALRNMLTDEPAKQQLGESGRLLVEQRFNLPKIVEQTENIYKAVVSEKV